MKRARAVVAVAVAGLMTGCMGAQIKTASTWELVDQEPIFEMMTTVKDAFGYEATIVKTFQRTSEGGVRMIRSEQVGGPGLGYALTNTAVDGLTDVASAGVLGLTAIEAASKIRPDNTNVTQKGGGATATSTGGAGGDGGIAVAGSAAVAGAVSVSNAAATARQSQKQEQGQAQQQSSQDDDGCKPKGR